MKKEWNLAKLLSINAIRNYCRIVVLGVWFKILAPSVAELVESALSKNVEVYDFSNGNLPIENKLPSVINYFGYGKAS